MNRLQGIADGARRPQQLDKETDEWKRMDQLLLRPEEAARVLGIGRSKLFELLATSALPVVRIGRATRIPAPALRRWVEEHTVGAGVTAPTDRDPLATSERSRGRDEQWGSAPRWDDRR